MSGRFAFERRDRLANHRHELCAIDLDEGEVRVLDTSPANRIQDLAFSPDGRYIAYVSSPTRGASIIRVVKVRSGKVHDVTSPLRVDHSPAWDPQGKYLYFISTRDFHPVYDALQFDLSFPQAQRPFVVTLRSDVPSPFVPQPRPVHREHDHDHEHDAEKKNGKPEELRIDIDFDGIAGRVLGFPVEEGEYEQLVAVKGRVLYTRFPVRGIKNAYDDDDAEEASAERSWPTTLKTYAKPRSQVTSAKYAWATTATRSSIARTIACAPSTPPPISATMSRKNRRPNRAARAGGSISIAPTSKSSRATNGPK